MMASQGAWSLELPAGPFANLRDEEFRKRERAQADLLAWVRTQGEPAIDELLRQSKVADDPEVRERCLAILREWVNDDYVKHGEGFIGIRMLEEITNLPGDPKPCSVIRVIQVVPDSAAHQAGLQINDLIAGMDDQVWYEGGVVLKFREQIRQLQPKTKIRLKVLRGGKLIEIDVILARRPLQADAMFFDDRQIDREAAEKAAKDAYFRRWLEHRKSPK